MRSLLLFTLIVLSRVDLWSQYHVYESGYNQIGQTMIQTRDNGYLIAALEFCYTPELWVIEGCPVGINLIKTDASGAVQWSNEIENSDILGVFHLYENDDSTFTIITSQDGSDMCGEIIVGPYFGLPQVVVYKIDASGNVLSQKVFPEECELSLISSARLSDSTFVVLTKYSDEFAGGNVEGRILKMTTEGIVLDSIVFPSESFQKGSVLVDSNQQAWVFYMDASSTLRANVYDSNLTLLDQNANSTLDSACLSSSFDTEASFRFLSNGTILAVCHSLFDTVRNLQFYLFTPDLVLLGHETHTLPYVNGFTISQEEEIVVVSEERNTDSFDIRLSFYDLNGEFIETSIHAIPGNQMPTEILQSHDHRFVVVGSHNCCNLHESIGPGHSFLWISEHSTAVDHPDLNGSAMHIFPNPAHDQIQIEIPGWESHSALWDIKIYTTTGIMMKELAVNYKSAISIMELPHGAYYLVAKNAYGNVRTGRLIKLD